MNIIQRIFLSSTVVGVFLLTACSGNASSTVVIPEAPDAAMRTIATELIEGNGGILWQAMPASYQADVNEIAQLAGKKVDAEMYDKSFSLVGRLAKVADQQKEFILNTKIGTQQSGEQIAKLEAAWPSIVGFIQTIANSSIASSEGLQSFNGQDFCDKTVSALVAYSKDLATVSGQSDPLDLGSVKVINSTETTAVLEFTSSDGIVETKSFTKVEDRWVPTEVANDWTQNLSEAREKLLALTPEEMAQNKPQVMGAITMFDGILTQLETAKTQEQFDQAVKGAMMPLMGLMMMQGGMGGSSAPAAPAVGPTAP